MTFVFRVGKARGLDVMIVDSRAIKTSRGVGIGDSLPRFRQAYKGVRAVNRHYRPDGFMAKTGPHLGIRVWVRGKKIVSMALGRWSVLDYYEFCS